MRFDLEDAHYAVSVVDSTEDAIRDKNTLANEFDGFGDGDDGKGEALNVVLRYDDDADDQYAVPVARNDKYYAHLSVNPSHRIDVSSDSSYTGLQKKTK